MNQEARMAKLQALCTMALAAGLVGPVSANAAVLVYDGFGVGTDAGQYTNNAGIGGVGHGTGWSGDWEDSSGNYVTRTGSIAPAGLDSEDGVLIRAGGNSDSLNISRPYSSTFGGANPSVGEVWFSFAFQRNTSQRELRVNPLGNNHSAGQYMGIFLPTGSAEMVARIRYGTSTQIIDSTDSFEVTLGTAYLVVGQALLNAAGTEDQLNIYVVEASSFNGTLPATPSMTVSYDFNSSFNRWAMYTQNPQGNEDVVVFDEFRIGESFTDVSPIPEPASLTLLGGAATV
jgi:hypothetical protein